MSEEKRFPQAPTLNDNSSEDVDFASTLRENSIEDNDIAQFLAREVLRGSCQANIDAATLEGETERQILERLGRQRPEQLTVWHEIGFVFSIVMSQALNEIFLSGFTILIPPVIEALDIPPQSVTWPTNAYTIAIAAFLIPFGRVADMYGGFLVYIGGMAWFTIMALVISFSRNSMMLDVCRALQGLGPAAYLPAGLTLLGNMYRPGPRKNIIFSIYGSIAALGFYIGMLFAGLIGQYTNWPAFFWIGTGISFLTTVVAYREYRSTHARYCR
jgi:MFS family permease